MDKDTINLLVNGGTSTVIYVVIIVICYWLFKHLLDQQLESRKADFQKDIDKYKTDLEKEKNAFMIKIEQDKQRFQMDLDRQLAEHSVLFNSLNNERFRVSNELFGLLVNLFGMGKAYTSIIKVVPNGREKREFEEEQLNNFFKEYQSFWNIYSPNRLYFDENLSTQIFNLGNDLQNNVREYAFKKKLNFKGFGDEPGKIMKENFDNIITLEPKVKEIENNLRMMLGVI